MRTTGIIIHDLFTKTGLEEKYGKPLAHSYITISGVNAGFKRESMEDHWHHYIYLFFTKCGKPLAPSYIIISGVNASPTYK